MLFIILLGINSLASGAITMPDDSEGISTGSDKSIAVLPFANLSDDPENEYFTEGLSEEVLARLAQLPELHVAGRTSSFKYRGHNLDLREVAQNLGVANLLEGSVRKAGNRVRITAQLLRAEDGYHLWSETYDRSLDNIFVIQEEIATAVVAQLKLTLLGVASTENATDL